MLLPQPEEFVLRPIRKEWVSYADNEEGSKGNIHAN
jgi:hypothetical protein